MKILMINSVCGIRSTGRICTDIAKQYIADGHEVKIAYGREKAPQEFESIAIHIGAKFDTYINALNARLFDNEGFNCKRTTKLFLKWADGYDPDLLWLHNLHGYYINIEMLFAWIKSRPKMKVKWTLHDCWAFTGHCAHFSYVGCEQWKTGCKRCVQTRTYPSAFKDNCKENYRRKKEAFCGVKDMTIITPSHWLAGLVQKSFLGEYPVNVLHNTIDTEIFKPTKSNFREKYGLEDKKIILGVATSWGASKGLYDFVELAKHLDDSYKIVLVGITRKQQKKMPKNILVLERTNNPHELAGIYSTSDIFLNLTYEDTYPTVNLEARSCGTICITYRTGGSVESVPAYCVVEQGDLEKIYDIIKEI